METEKERGKLLVTFPEMETGQETGKGMGKEIALEPIPRKRKYWLIRYDAKVAPSKLRRSLLSNLTQLATIDFVSQFLLDIST
jgi:hypothetical protein